MLSINASLFAFFAGQLCEHCDLVCSHQHPVWKWHNNNDIVSNVNLGNIPELLMRPKLLSLSLFIQNWSLIFDYRSYVFCQGPSLNSSEGSYVFLSGSLSGLLWGSGLSFQTGGEGVTPSSHPWIKVTFISINHSTWYLLIYIFVLIVGSIGMYNSFSHSLFALTSLPNTNDHLAIIFLGDFAFLFGEICNHVFL